MLFITGLRLTDGFRLFSQLDVNTVAAGGGSRLFFRSGIFVVGPESVGAHPGPVCYRKGLYSVGGGIDDQTGAKHFYAKYQTHSKLAIRKQT